MSQLPTPSTHTKIVVTFLFVVVGLPPGLCSLYVAPFGIAALVMHDPDPRGYNQIFFAACLIGFTIFGLMLWWLIRTWRRRSP